MRLITKQLLDDLLAQAAADPRGRVPYRFHEHEDPVQRMLNAITPGSYTLSIPGSHGDSQKAVFNIR